MRPFRMRLVAKWFDLWIGVFIDPAKLRVYVLPLPCLGISIQFASRIRCSHPDCDNVAKFKCVRRDKYETRGENYAREPLCDKHGEAGPCRLLPEHQTHEPIPPDQQWEFL